MFKLIDTKIIAILRKLFFRNWPYDIHVSLWISGPSDQHEFQAETRKLLDIVARSLYSEKEVSCDVLFTE